MQISIVYFIFNFYILSCQINGRYNTNIIINKLITTIIELESILSNQLNNENGHTHKKKQFTIVTIVTKMKNSRYIICILR